MQGKVLSLIALVSLALVYLGGSADFNNLRNNQATEFQSIQPIFEQWKLKNGYQFTAQEAVYRLSQFAQNYKFVEQFNAEQTGSLRLGMTPFAAMDLEEFKQFRTAPLTQAPLTVEQPKRFKSVPSSVNWVDKGAVAPVENQGSCGSCWAFSTKEGLEGLHAIKSGNLEVLSAQQLVDCSIFNLGCNGGDPMTAYKYTQNKGIVSEEDYPYFSGTTGAKGECKFNPDQVVFKNGGQVRVSPVNDVNAIQQAAANQPLTIEVAAGNIYFQLYTSGIIDSAKCPTALDHGILLAGYNNGNSTPYWLVKNSWGSSWGENGYARIAIQDGVGICGIQQYVAYPTL